VHVVFVEGASLRPATRGLVL